MKLAPRAHGHWRPTRSCGSPRPSGGCSPRGADLIDFGIGEPREQTPAFIREALVAALRPLSTYPQSDGLPELRAAIAGWAQRRFGAALDPDTQVLPTLGSKEAIFHLAQVLGGGAVAIPAPAYPVYERGALFAGKRVLELPLREATRLPARPRRGRREHVARRRGPVAQLPEQPDRGHGAARALRARRGARARARLRRRVATRPTRRSTSATSRRLSVLELADLSGVLVFNTLSKRSSMPGYRSGLRGRRPGADRAAQALPAERRHRAAGVHPARRGRGLERRGARRAGARVLRRQARRAAGVLEAHGLRSAGGDATFFLWLDAGPGADALAERLMADGIVLAPGSFFGPAGARLPAARARADAGGVRARRRAPRQAALTTRSRAAPRSGRLQRPLRGIASIAPVCELRRNSSPSAPLSSAALTTSPSGSATREPPVT